MMWIAGLVGLVLILAAVLVLLPFGWGLLVVGFYLVLAYIRDEQQGTHR